MSASCTALIQLQAMYDRLMRYRAIMVYVILQPNFEGDHAGEESLFYSLPRSDPTGGDSWGQNFCDPPPTTYARTV